MFSNDIVESNLFLEMPPTSQALCFHLCMNADDDGFVNNPKSILRAVRASQEDFKLLISKQFIIPLDSGIYAVAHWKIHNER